jgi:tRNA-specific 2-thiouridylase
MAKAIALFSGGLDSTLAILTMLRQGVEVEAIIFRTQFGCDLARTRLHLYVSPSPTPPVPGLAPRSGAGKGGETVGIAPVKGWEHTPAPLSRGDLPSPPAGEGESLPRRVEKLTQRGKDEGYANWYDGALSSNDPFSVAEKFGFEVRPCNLSDKFIELVKNPEFGYGRNMNPCIDCRILMLKEARVVMDTTGADFIITGEVLGQRPMSQRRDTFNLIDREAEVTDYVLRPLSAKLLKITFPEAKGIIKRGMLYGFNGRSRKPQMALAEEFGLTDYPSPAGGCLLTEPNYAHRLKDLLTYDPAPGFRDVDLLRIGRHFRFSPFCKIIVGRNKTENAAIQSMSMNGDWLLKVEGYGSPVTLVSGEITDEALKAAASICARYSDAKDLSEAETIVIKDRNALCVMSNELKDKDASRITHHGSRITDYEFRIKVSPASNEIIEALRIEKRNKNKTRAENASRIIA